jgi:hypothetical protein
LFCNTLGGVTSNACLEEVWFAHGQRLSVGPQS